VLVVWSAKKRIRFNQLSPADITVFIQFSLVFDDGEQNVIAPAEQFLELQPKRNSKGVPITFKQGNSVSGATLSDEFSPLLIRNLRFPAFGFARSLFQNLRRRLLCILRVLFVELLHVNASVFHTPLNNDTPIQ
jgi:hypothetical protein